MTKRLVQFEDWTAIKNSAYEDYILYLKRYHIQYGTEFPDLSDISGEIEAYVNHGRWVVMCPTVYYFADGSEIRCNTALLATEQCPIFSCPVCGNINNNGKAYKVIFPSKIKEIEEILLSRPAHHPEYADIRNWYPDETIDQLIEENKRMGIIKKDKEKGSDE